jgi:hypothetical protein
MVTVFTLQQGNVNITDVARYFPSPVLIHCEEDGEVKVTWRDGQVDTIVLSAGEDRFLEATKSGCNVASGKFSFSSVIGG